MASIIDTLVTKYTMDDRDYQRGAQSVTKATAGISKSVGGVRNIVVAAGAAAIAVGALGAGAMVAAGEFDRSSQAFAGVFGSLQKGQSVMRALEEHSIKSSFGLEALTENSVQLTATGLSLQRFLPLAEKFALVIGGVDPQGLQQVVSALTRIKGGDFGEAMEVFRKAGISANDLRAQGIEITAGNQIKSSPEALYQALERISGKGSRIDNIATAVAESDATKLSTLVDNIGVAFRQLGTELNKAFLPVALAVTEAVRNFARNGGFAAITASLHLISPEVKNFEGVIESVVRGLVGAITFFRTTVSESLAYVQQIFDDLRNGRLWSAKNKILGYGEAGVKWTIDAYKNAQFAMYEYDQHLFQGKREALVNDRAASGLPGTPPGDNSTATEKLPEITRPLRELVEIGRKQYDLQRAVFGAGAAARGINVENLSDTRAGLGRRSRRSSKSGDILRQVGILLAEYVGEAQYAR